MRRVLTKRVWEGGKASFGTAVCPRLWRRACAASTTIPHFAKTGLAFDEVAGTTPRLKPASTAQHAVTPDYRPWSRGLTFNPSHLTSCTGNALAKVYLPLSGKRPFYLTLSWPFHKKHARQYQAHDLTSFVQGLYRPPLLPSSSPSWLSCGPLADTLPPAKDTSFFTSQRRLDVNVSSSELASDARLETVGESMLRPRQQDILHSQLHPGPSRATTRGIIALMHCQGDTPCLARCYRPGR